jgi:putative component of toxin-antitoxin plasmid stabilization module
MCKIKHYITSDDQDVFAQWLHKLKDMTAKIAIACLL